MTCTFHRSVRTALPTVHHMDLVRGGRRRPLRARIQGAELSLVPGRDATEGGRITAAGMPKDVSFEPLDGPINDRIDDAYRAKYKGSPYLSAMIGAGARA